MERCGTYGHERGQKAQTEDGTENLMDNAA
jgi:hypothetical protein